ncbi:MAG: hypothetical protein V4561_09850 [Bacteroidota bacterium]
MNIIKDEKNVLNRNNSESGKSNNQTSILKSLMFCTLNQRLQLIEQTLCVNSIDDKYRVLDNALFFNVDKL